MSSFVQSVNYGAINTVDTTINGFCAIKFISDAYKLQNNTTIDGKIISVRGLFVREQYLCSIKEDSNGYGEQQLLQQNILVPTHTILRLCLHVFIMTHVQDIPITVCNRIHTKNPYKDTLFF